MVEMGHDGPRPPRGQRPRSAAARPRRLPRQARLGVSVEFDVRHGPVTLLGLGQDADGTLSFVTSEGTVVPGPHLAIGNTTSRVDFGRDPGEWVDAWSATGVGHHWSLALGHHTADFRAAASLLGIEHREA